MSYIRECQEFSMMLALEFPSIPVPTLAEGIHKFLTVANRYRYIALVKSVANIPTDVQIEFDLHLPAKFTRINCEYFDGDLRYTLTNDPTVGTVQVMLRNHDVIPVPVRIM